jgi:hypothetical protein
MLFKQISEGFLGKLLDGFHPILGQSVECVPSRGIDWSDPPPGYCEIQRVAHAGARFRSARDLR